MTIVVAKKFKDRICVMSDTMITDENICRSNILPGRLKSIVINEWLTISYAGLSTQAVDAARYIYNGKNFTTSFAIEYLSKLSARYCDAMDFIICSHETTPRLLKISNGSVSEGAKVYWIGSGKAASELSKLEVPEVDCENLPDYMSTEEVYFRNAFNVYMRENQCEGIGGGIIDCLCSPYGHCYNTHAAAFSWDTIVLGKDDQVEREAKNKTGMYHYEYHVSSASVRGQAIVGIYLDQVKIGFIYDPIHYDEAMKIRNVGLVEFSELVEYTGIVLSRRGEHDKAQ